MPAERRTCLGEVPNHRRPAGRQFLQEPREQLLEDGRASWHERVHVSILWHALSVLPILHKRIPVDDRHASICIGQHPCSKQPTHAAAEDQPVFTDLPHDALPESAGASRYAASGSRRIGAFTQPERRGHGHICGPGLVASRDARASTSKTMLRIFFGQPRSAYASSKDRRRPAARALSKCPCGTSADGEVTIQLELL